MSYCLKRKELKLLKNHNFVLEFTGAEMLVATYVTDEQRVKEIIPKPLLPDRIPMATVFVARYPETNFGCTYNEGALLLHCTHKNEHGLYCLSMQVDDDTALTGGREIFGYPKKMADRITLQTIENNVVGRVIRKGEEILRIECQLLNESLSGFADATWVETKDWNDCACYRGIVFLYKYFPSPGGRGFDYLPRLIREPILLRKQGEILEGRGQVVVGSSPFDPLGDIPVREVTSMFYGKWSNTMLPGKVVARIWSPFRFLKHAFSKTDIVPAILQNYDPSTAKRAAEIGKAARRF